MAVEVRTIADTYQDSVKLMRIASDAEGTFDLEEAVAMMGTEENKKSLVDLGIIETATLEEARPDDLILAAKHPDAETAAAALEQMAADVTGASGSWDSGDREIAQPRSLYTAMKRLPDANLALISTPGEYATREAWKALHEGLHVHIFSDNVSIENEQKLKAFGAENDQFVMGPDCGSAIIDGAPLGFANDVAEGAIGVVSAAGTGLQEVTSLVDRAGAGVSQAIGTGGRDLKDAIGGVTMKQGLAALEADDDTDVVVLVSKPPGDETLASLEDAIAACEKPVVVNFIGSDAAVLEDAGAIVADTLADAARLAVTEIGGDASFDAGVDAFTDPDADIAVDGDRSYLRGLYSGGTLTAEAYDLLAADLDGIATNIGSGDALDDALNPTGHALVDLGADEFTRGRPHPMIDSSIRNDQLEAALAADDVAVVLLDVVLGYGASDDPAGDVATVLDAADEDRPVVVASVTGTTSDPQNWAGQIDALVEAGAYVCESNAAAVQLTANLLAAADGGDSQ